MPPARSRGARPEAAGGHGGSSPARRTRFRFAGRFRLAGVPLRTRLVLLSLVLVLLGLAVSDTVVLGSVRGQLVARVDQQLQRYGQPLARRLGSEGVPPRMMRMGGPRALLPSQYVVAFASADGSVSDQFRLPVAAGDPKPLWPRMDAATLRARFG